MAEVTPPRRAISATVVPATPCSENRDTAASSSFDRTPRLPLPDFVFMARNLTNQLVNCKRKRYRHIFLDGSGGLISLISGRNRL